MSFSRYPAYKDSGVEWLGEVPDHWAVAPLKRYCAVFPSNVDKKSYDGQIVVSLCNYTDVYYNEKIVVDKPYMQATATFEQIERFQLRAGDVVFTKDSESADDIAIAAYVPESIPNLIYGYHLSIARPYDGTVGVFVKRYFDSQSAKAYFAVHANGLTRVGLSQYSTDNLPTPFPPTSEQFQIARFLDHETAKIDALIEEQQRLIELLKEKRQAVISQAVTKGLDSNVPMKDSRVEWLGEVPAHWDVAGLTKYIEPVVDYRGRTPKKQDDGMLLVTARNIRQGRIDYETSVEFVDPEEAQLLLARGKPEIGDVLFTMEAPLGHVAQVDKADIALAQRVVKFRGIKALLRNDYLLFFLMSQEAQSVISSLSTGSTVQGIKASKLGMIPCLAPPLEEQASIVQTLETTIEKLEALAAEAKVVQTLLQERRSALISAAVTGKIDVRDWRPPTSSTSTHQASSTEVA